MKSYLGRSLPAGLGVEYDDVATGVRMPNFAIAAWVVI